MNETEPKSSKGSASQNPRESNKSNEYRNIKNREWMTREAKRLRELLPVAYGSALRSLKVKIGHAEARLNELS